MVPQYFIWEKDQLLGPFSFNELRGKRIQENTQICKNRFEKFQPAKAFPELRPLFMQANPANPTLPTWREITRTWLLKSFRQTLKWGNSKISHRWRIALAIIIPAALLSLGSYAFYQKNRAKERKILEDKLSQLDIERDSLNDVLTSLNILKDTLEASIKSIKAIKDSLEQLKQHSLIEPTEGVQAHNNSLNSIGYVVPQENEGGAILAAWQTSSMDTTITISDTLTENSQLCPEELNKEINRLNTARDCLKSEMEKIKGNCGDIENRIKEINKEYDRVKKKLKLKYGIKIQ